VVELRPYQEECVAAHWRYLRCDDGNPLFVVPTAGGKSHIIAAFLQRSIESWPSTRAIVLTHVKELIEQNHDKFVQHVGAFAPVGIYSAGIGSRDTHDRVIFAGIQSMYERARELGHFDLALIDEAHLIPKKGEGRYLTYLAALREINPRVRVLGYTATHYRLDGGYLHRGEGRIFTDVAYEIPIERLVREGFLSPLVSKRPNAGIIDTSGIATQNGDFKRDDLETAANRPGAVEAAVEEIVRYGREQNRRAWLLFACGIDHARAIALELARHEISWRFVSGKTPKDEREQAVQDFKASRFTALVNVGVFTTGFDAPNVDLLGFLRPTQSTGLYVQIMGRGMRLSPATGKKDCLVLDFGGNIERHGPVNRVKPKRESSDGEPPIKVCPACASYVMAGVRTCPDCGFEFSAPESRGPVHERVATDLRPLDMEPAVPVCVDVDEVYYRRHEGRDGKPPTFRADYMCGMRFFSEFVCLEHGGFALRKAQRWWLEHSSLRGTKIPANVLDALGRIEELRCPLQIEVKRDGKYERVARVRWTGRAPSVNPGAERLGFAHSPSGAELERLRSNEEALQRLRGELDETPF